MEKNIMTRLNFVVASFVGFLIAKDFSWHIAGACQKAIRAAFDSDVYVQADEVSAIIMCATIFAGALISSAGKKTK